MSTYSVLGQLALGWGAYFFATASPGPGVMTIMATATSSGRKAGLALAFGILSGSMTWAFLTTIGLSGLIAAVPALLAAIRLAGGLYLLWLAFGAARRAWEGSEPKAGSVSASASLRGHYLKGYGVHLTNPKAVMAWLTLGSIALPSGAGWAITLTFTIGCLIIGTVVFTGFALLFSTPAVHAAYIRHRRPVEAAVAIFFCFAGAALLTAVR